MADRYWVGGTDTWNATAASKWAATSGGAGGSSVPTSSDNAFFDGNSGSGTVSGGSPGNPMTCTNLDFSGFTGTFSNAVGSGSIVLVAGNLAFGSGMTLTGALAFKMTSTSTGKTITTNNKTIPMAITFDGVGGGWTLADSLLMTTGAAAPVLTLTNGTFNLGGFNVTCRSFSSNNSNTRTLTIGSGTFTVGDSNTGAAWDLATITGLTLSAYSGEVVVVSTAARTFAGGGATYGSVRLKPTSGTLVYTVTGSSTFGTLSLDSSNVGFTTRLTAGTTQTTMTLSATGSSGKVITIDTTSAGSAASFSVSTGTVSCDWLSLKDNTATGGASFYAGANSTNVSGNTGWTFTPPPGSSSVKTVDGLALATVKTVAGLPVASVKSVQGLP